MLDTVSHICLVMVIHVTHLFFVSRKVQITLISVALVKQTLTNM